MSPLEKRLAEFVGGILGKRWFDLQRKKQEITEEKKHNPLICKKKGKLNRK